MTEPQPVTDLVGLLAKAITFARLWKMQDGCGAQVLDELADAVVEFLDDNPLLARASAHVGSRDVKPAVYYCPACATARPLADPCAHIDIEPGTLQRVRELLAEQRAARVEWLTRGVTDRELRAAQRQAARFSNDFLWITRLRDGRALFLMPWSGMGVQLSVGALGDRVFVNTWNYHPGHTDDGWRAALTWDGHGEPDGWTRHPASGRVRLDGTAASEAVER